VQGLQQGGSYRCKHRKIGSVPIIVNEGRSEAPIGTARITGAAKVASAGAATTSVTISAAVSGAAMAVTVGATAAEKLLF